MGGKKFLILFLGLITARVTHAVDENFYMGGQPYYNFGSSYYPKWTNDYYWGGDGWIFKTGYKAPTQRCCSRVKCTRPCTWCRAYRKSLPRPVRVDGAQRMETSPLGSFGTSIEANGQSYSENSNNCCNRACRP